MSKMVKKANATKKGISKSKTVRINANDIVTADIFEYANAILESAVTGAIISGIYPRAIESGLAFRFLLTAAKVRGITEPNQTTWLKNGVFAEVVMTITDLLFEHVH